MSGARYKDHQKEIILHINAIGGSVPAHRRASKHLYSFREKSFDEQFAIWDYVWCHTESFWIRAHAFFFLEQHVKDDNKLRQMWPVIVQWQDHVDDWALCDALAKIYTKILVVAPVKVYAQLKKWNSDNNLWKRRQSVVSLLYYSRTKKDYLPFHKIEKLVTALLKDKEYYVQKGVGWCLREMYTVYPDDTLDLVTKHIKSISSIAFTIAIEKMSVSGKNRLKATRKAGR
jgi:3-methyladenine DNA glycosylase AlkC